MEPLSTLALVAAFLAPVPLTRRPDWVVGSRASKVPELIVESDARELSAPSTVATDSILMPSLPRIFSDHRELLAREVKTYAFLEDGWDGEGSARPTEYSTLEALRFIDRLPGGLPPPHAMVSSAGELGFYWDLEGGYADISFAADGSASFFSRTHSGQEFFQEALNSDNFSREWFFQVLGVMAAPQVAAA